MSPRGAPQCVTTGCIKFGQIVEGKFCSECGQIGVTPAPPSQTLNLQLVCLKKDCVKFDQPVGKFCSGCGSAGGYNQPPKLCRSPDCQNSGNVVSGKFCSGCGKEPSSAPLIPLCKTTGCDLFGKEVKGKFCAECGQPPST